MLIPAAESAPKVLHANLPQHLPSVKPVSRGCRWSWDEGSHLQSSLLAGLASLVYDLLNVAQPTETQHHCSEIEVWRDHYESTILAGEGCGDVATDTDDED